MSPNHTPELTSPTISTLLRQAKTTLAPLHDTASLDAEVLLAECLSLSRAQLHAFPERAVNPAAAERFLTLVARRARGEPIAYLVGYREFWSLRLKVTPATLIPRPETELLVEQALAKLPADRPTEVLDLGTGSGAIALAIATERPLARLTAVDLSADALTVARVNAQDLNIQNVEFILGDWFSELAGRHFDLIAANPPYIAPSDPYLEQGDLRFEPELALSCGANGLAAAQIIVGEGRRYLRPDGWLLMEHGHDQAEALARLFAIENWKNVKNLRDYAGRPRLVVAQAA